MSDASFYSHAALSLTSQRDGEALARALLSLLESRSLVGEASILKVYGLKGSFSGKPIEHLEDAVIRRFDSEQGNVRHARPNICGVLDALQTGGPVEVPGTDEQVQRLVIPVPGRSNPLRVVVLDEVAPEPELRLQLLHVVELFGNQVELLDSRERDQLTGLLNRLAFAQRYLQMVRANASDPTASVWLAVMDIDHFKRVNDTFGHLYGDEVLLHFAQLMERTFRYSDFLFRFGGEEFIVLLRTTQKGAKAALERFRKVIEEFDFPGVGQITVSIGYSCAGSNMLPPDLVDQADQALYQAKQGGRNRVVRFAEDGAGRSSGDIEMF